VFLITLFTEATLNCFIYRVFDYTLAYGSIITCKQIVGYQSNSKMNDIQIIYIIRKGNPNRNQTSDDRTQKSENTIVVLKIMFYLLSHNYFIIN
jgi:hypothetical protein